MKKQIFALTLFVGLTILMTCCSNEKGANLEECNNIRYGNPEDPISTIEYSLIDSMINKYERRQLAAINNQYLDFPDSEAIWFSLKTLKNFIYNIEKSAKCNQDSTLEEKLGVRIYYAAYPDPESNTNCNEIDNGISFNNIYQNLDGIDQDIYRYVGRHTLVMIPTIRKNGVDTDFNPIDSATYNKNGLEAYKGYSANTNECKFILSLTPIPAIFNSEDTADPKNTSARNHGGLFPPRSMDGLIFKK